MGTLWKNAKWLAIVGVPTCLVYLNNFRGIASNLDDAADDVAPLLGALVPFLFIALGALSLAVIATYLWVHGRRKLRKWLYAEELEFRKLAGPIGMCKINLVSFHDTPSFMMDEGQRAERIARLNAELSDLFTQLHGLDISVPSPVGSRNDHQQPVKLISYLTSLESLAERGNLPGARGIEAPW